MQAVFIKDVKKDCIYYAKNKVESGVDYIIRAMHDGGGYKTFITLPYKQDPAYYTTNSSGFNWAQWDLRFPTTEEADWLVACEQAGKFVPRPNQITRVINDYQIY